VEKDETAGAGHAREASNLRDYNCPALSGNAARPEKRPRGGSHLAAPDVAPAAGETVVRDSRGRRRWGTAASSREEEVEEEEGAGGAGRAARPSARRAPPAVEEEPRVGRRVSQPRQAYKPSAYGARGEGSPRKEAGGKREEDIASQEEVPSPSGRRTGAEQEGEGREQTARKAPKGPNLKDLKDLRDYNCPGTTSEKQTAPRAERRVPQVFFFFTLVTGPRRSLSLKLSDKRVYGP